VRRAHHDQQAQCLRTAGQPVKHRSYTGQTPANTGQTPVKRRWNAVKRDSLAGQAALVHLEGVLRRDAAAEGQGHTERLNAAAPGAVGAQGRREGASSACPRLVSRLWRAARRRSLGGRGRQRSVQLHPVIRGQCSRACLEPPVPCAAHTLALPPQPWTLCLQAPGPPTWRPSCWPCTCRRTRRRLDVERRVGRCWVGIV
jgi:hypothetical protein